MTAQCASQYPEMSAVESQIIYGPCRTPVDVPFWCTSVTAVPEIEAVPKVVSVVWGLTEYDQPHVFNACIIGIMNHLVMRVITDLL